MENLLDGWGLTVATFSPLLGVAVMLLIPKEREDRHRLIALVTSLWVAFVSLLVLVADAVPQTGWSPIDNETFSKVFGLNAPAVFASMVAYLSAQFIDIRIFHFWKKLTKGKHLWLRNNGSTVVSQLVDTGAVLSLLCSFGVIEWERFGGLLLNGFLFKVLVAFFDTPLFYAAVWYLKPRIGDENSPVGATEESTDKREAPGGTSPGE